jgi:hypothetical protein
LNFKYLPDIIIGINILSELMSCEKLCAFMMNEYDAYNDMCGVEDSFKNTVFNWSRLCADETSKWNIQETNKKYFGKFMMRLTDGECYKLFLCILLSTTPCINAIKEYCAFLGFGLNVVNVSHTMKSSDALFELTSKVIMYLLLRESNSRFLKSFIHINECMTRQIVSNNLDNTSFVSIIKGILLMNCPELIGQLGSQMKQVMRIDFIQPALIDGPISTIDVNSSIRTNDFTNQLTDTILTFSGNLRQIEETDRFVQSSAGPSILGG